MCEHVQWTCGAPLWPPGDHVFNDKLYLRMAVTCNDPVEGAFYQATGVALHRADIEQNICSLCAIEADEEAGVTVTKPAALLERYRSVRPICNVCSDTGLKPPVQGERGGKRKRGGRGAGV